MSKGLVKEWDEYVEATRKFGGIGNHHWVEGMAQRMRDYIVELEGDVVKTQKTVSVVSIGFGDSRELRVLLSSGDELTALTCAETFISYGGNLCKFRLEGYITS